MKPVKFNQPTNNFNDWYLYYGPVLEPYYNDFIKLFEKDSYPSFLDFTKYCYINTKSYYNSNKNKYECRIYRDY